MKLTLFACPTLFLEQSANLVRHGLQYSDMRNRESMRRWRKNRQYTDHLGIFLDRRNHHGADTQGANCGVVDAGVGFGIVTAQFLAGLNAEPGERAFHAQRRTDVWRAGTAARAADNLIFDAFT